MPNRLPILAATAAIALAACGGDDLVPVADITPTIARLCRLADADLVAIGAMPADRDAVSATSAVLLTFTNGLPKVDTELGVANDVVGKYVRGLNDELRSVTSAYDQRAPLDDAATARTTMRVTFKSTNDAASAFGVEECLSSGVWDDVLLPQLAGLDDFLAAIEPTGDYVVDFAEACGRFRTESAQVLVENATDPNADFLVFTRVRGLVDRFGADIERFDPPSDAAANHAAMLAAITNYTDAVDAVEAARLNSQEALDEALLDFDEVDAEFERLITKISPDC